MIIKILCDGNPSYFECDEVKIRRDVPQHEVQDGRGLFAECLMLLSSKFASNIPSVQCTSGNVTNLQVSYGPTQMVSVIIMTVKDSIKTVVTDSPGYIMNGEGKTIDRIG